MKLSPRVKAGAIALPLFLLLPFVLSEYYIGVSNLVAIYAIATMGLLLLIGGTGLVTFGQAAMMGVGAYTSAWLTTRHAVSPWVGLPVAVTVSGFIALVLGSITLNLRGHYLPLSTIAWGLALCYLFGALEPLGRYNGIGRIPPITVLGLAITRTWEIHYLVWIFAAVLFVAVANLASSRTGRAIRIQRGGALLSGSLGIPSFKAKLTAFVLAAVLAAIAGWLYAHTQRFVSPSPFNLLAGVQFLLFSVVGGVTSIVGAILGPAVIVLAQTFLQPLLAIVTSNAANVETIVLGAIFIVVLQFAPNGLMPHLKRLLAGAFAQNSEKPEEGFMPLPVTPPRATQNGIPLLSVEGVSKRFGGLVAVDGFRFDIRAAEILALIGPNGAGKSTLFGIISGALQADKGRIAIDGQDITALADVRRAELGIARTFQHVKLQPDLSVIENVLVGAHLRLSGGLVSGMLRLNHAQEQAALAGARVNLARVGLTSRLDVPACELPLGTQRQVEIARCLMSQPRLLMLDEPAAGLRKNEKEALARLIQQLSQEGLTVLLVEHDMDFVMGLAQRIVVMNFGTKIMEGSPAEARSHPQVKQAYLGAD